MPSKNPQQQRVQSNARLFSYTTRRYLQRRAARYFRRLGFQLSDAYPRLVSDALKRYRDEDFESGESILDNWSLMQLAFRHSDVLVFKRTSVEVVDARTLGELTAAPRFEELWQHSSSAVVLLDLLTRAQSRLVRIWSIQLIRRYHLQALHSISVEHLLSLLDHHDTEVQQFGASLLDSVSGIDNWPVTTWLRLLETRSVTALAMICDAMKKRVHSNRMSVEQCVALVCVRPTPIARLGLAWLQEKRPSDLADRSIVRRLANVQCDAVGEEASQFALSVLGAAQGYRTDDVCPFFDSLNGAVRQGAWLWLTPDSPGYADPLLWSRLLESPYDDVKFRLVNELNLRQPKPGVPRLLGKQDLTPLWISVLLGVHRGGRSKLHALRQISQAISDHPDRAAQLIPVLTVAIRSVRPPEARAGLSALLSAVKAQPQLESVLSQHLPELRISPDTEAS